MSRDATATMGRTLGHVFSALIESLSPEEFQKRVNGTTRKEG
jgi:hypothetical protein